MLLWKYRPKTLKIVETKKLKFQSNFFAYNILEHFSFFSTILKFAYCTFCLTPILYFFWNKFWVITHTFCKLCLQMLKTWNIFRWENYKIRKLSLFVTYLWSSKTRKKLKPSPHHPSPANMGINIYLSHFRTSLPLWWRNTEIWPPNKLE